MRRRQLNKGRQWHGRYDDYLDTKHWRSKKRAYLRRHPRCYVCGGTKGLQVHHKIYTNLGQEPDRDLVTLCKDHHKLLHEFDLPLAIGHIIILEEGDDEIKTRPKRAKKKSGGVKYHIDPELLRGKSGDELNEIIVREKIRLDKAASRLPASQAKGVNHDWLRSLG